MKGKFVDETGKKYGRLTVLECARRDKDHFATWLCRCICGNEVVIRGNSLRSGCTQSCGCLHKLLPGKAAMHFLMATYRGKAHRRSLDWKLTEKQFAELTQQPCYYCGSEPKQVCSIDYLNGNYIYNGLDRVDNSKGYVIENVVPCCGICNRAKFTMPQDEFLEWISAIYHRYFAKGTEPCPNCNQPLAVGPDGTIRQALAGHKRWCRNRRKNV